MGSWQAYVLLVLILSAPFAVLTNSDLSAVAEERICESDDTCDTLAKLEQHQGEIPSDVRAAPSPDKADGDKAVVFTKGKAHEPRSTTMSWRSPVSATESTVTPPDVVNASFDSLPMPIVTVASRLLSPGKRLGDPREPPSESMSRNPRPRVLQFEPVPEGEAYVTDPTHAEPSFLAWAGSFVSVLQPQQFPLDLVRAALEKRISGEELITESLQAEPGFMAFIGVGIGLGVIVPLLGLFVCCCRLCGRCGSNKVQHHHNSCFTCQRRTLTTTLATISCCILLGVMVIILSNERLGGGVHEARQSVQNNVRDLDTFLRNTKMQLRYLVSNSLEQTVDAIYNDLDDIEYLLGRPLQRELAAEAQVEVALDSLLHISSSLRSIAGRMRALEESRSQAAARAEELRGRLQDLSADIQRFIARCSPDDASLCESIDTRGLDLGVRFSSFSFSEQLRLLSAVENHNLTETARHARYEFENIPKYVKDMTRNTREDVKRAVRQVRASLYSRVRGLDDVAFDLEVRTRDITWRVDEAALTLQGYEGYRWYTGLGISVSLGLVWTLMTIGICCGCCAHRSQQPPTERSCVSNSAGQTLISSVFFMFFFSSVLWLVVVALFVVGAHAHAFICHPLYEEPQYQTLTHFLDQSGMVFRNGPMLSSVLHPGRDVHLGIGEVLSQCKDGEASYRVFKLNHYFDIEKEVDYRTTLDLRNPLRNLQVNLSSVELLSPEAETHLGNFLRSIKIDITPYKREMEKPLVQKNLPALAEQMQNVAGQLRSVSSSAELFKMVARIRNLITNTLYPLEKRKEDVTYQVATLDLEVMPLQRQINQSSGHLRTIQYFIHNHGSSLAASKVRGYQERILGYMRQYSDHVRGSANHLVAPCTPFWNLFDSARGVTCNSIIEPVNALWLATGWCLLLFLPSILVTLSLARFYLRMDQDDDTLPLHSNGNGSPTGSSTNIQNNSSAMWGPKGNDRSKRSHHHHHQNGPNEGQHRNEHRRQRDRSSRSVPLDASEVVAGAQVAAWRDAWRSGASFVTLDLVSRHVKRPIDWVHHHWDDDPQVLATSMTNLGENRYHEPRPPTCSPTLGGHYSACGDCCDSVSSTAGSTPRSLPG